MTEKKKLSFDGFCDDPACPCKLDKYYHMSEEGICDDPECPCDEGEIR